MDCEASCSVHDRLLVNSSLEGGTAARMAAVNCHSDVLEFVLKKGFPFQCPFNHQVQIHCTNGLLETVEKGNVECSKMLLEKYKAEAVTFSRKLLPKIIIPVCKQPQRTLKDQCRVVLRNHLLTLHPHQPLFNRMQELTLPRMICDYWWLVRATYVVDGRFLVTFFGGRRRQCTHTHESLTATVHSN